MKRLTLALFGLATALAIAPAALADSFSYTFASSDNSVTLAATFTASNAGGGIYDISAVSGTFTDTNFGIVSQAITSLDPGIGPTPTPDTLFFYDNYLNPDTTVFSGSILDGNGVVFNLADGYEINLFGATGNFYYVNESPDQININFPAEYISLTPEPSSLLLFGSGLLALGAAAGRKLYA